MNRLKLFGGASIETAAGPLSGRGVQRHRLALLSLLASTRRPSRNREQLVAFLWPEADGERGRRLLSDSVYRINQALGEEAVCAAGDELRLDPNVLGTDVADFERAMGTSDWRGAINAYSGPFLDGFFIPDSVEFERWAEDERRRYARDVAKALESLASEAAHARRWHEAVDWWQRLAAHVPDNSRVAAELMRALDVAGDRAAAIRHARIHVTLVRETLGLEPDPFIETLAEQFRNGTAVRPMYASAVISEPAAASDAESNAEPGGASTDSAEAEQRVIEPAEEIPAPKIITAPPTTHPPASAPPAPHPAPLERRRPLAPIVLVGAALALVVAALLLLVKRDDRAAAMGVVPGGPATIAVLPFRNVSPADSDAYFVDGVTEELIYMLTRTPGLRVASRTSSFAYRDSTLDVRDLAARLGVDWVLEGSVRRVGQKLRITSQLTNARAGYQTWSETYDRSLSDVFTIQQDIARAIARSMELQLAGTNEPATPPPATSSVEAYDLYLRGRYFWSRRSAENLRRAREYFERAIAIDSGFARALSGIADCYNISGFYNYLAPAVAFPSAKVAALRALAIDSTLAEPHASLGYAAFYYEWDWAAAEREFSRAIELDPRYATAHQWLGNFLVAMNRPDEALAAFKQARDLDPLNFITNGAYCWGFMMFGRYDEARAQCTRTIDIDSTFVLGHMWMGQTLMVAGDLAGAERELDRAVVLSQRGAQAVASLAQVYARQGRGDRTRELLSELTRSGVAYVPSFEIAVTYAALGERDQAIDWLERAFRERDHALALLEVEPRLATLRSDPRYVALMRRVGLS